MAETVYNRGKYLLANGGMGGRDLRMAIVLGTTTGIDDVDLDTVADLDAVSGVSIHSERIALANESVTQDDVNNRVNLDADAAVFASASGVTGLAAVIYVEGANDAARELVTSYTTGFGAGLPMDGGLTVNIADWLRV
jgi:hypothetical protein